MLISSEWWCIKQVLCDPTVTCLGGITPCFYKVEIKRMNMNVSNVAHKLNIQEYVDKMIFYWPGESSSQQISYKRIIYIISHKRNQWSGEMLLVENDKIDAYLRTG